MLQLLSESDTYSVLPPPWNQEGRVPGMLFEGFPKLHRQHGFFFPSFDPIPQMIKPTPTRHRH